MTNDETSPDDVRSHNAAEQADPARIGEREIVSIGEVVSVGDVSDEVREELARLFGSAQTDTTTPAEISDDSVTLFDRANDAAIADDAGTDDTASDPAMLTHQKSLTTEDAPDNPAQDNPRQDTASEDNARPAGKSRVQRFARRRRERREVVPIGDLNFDSIAPLPVESERSGDDPLMPVVEIVDDFGRPDLEDASTVARVVTIDDDRGGSRSEVRERRRNRRRKLRQVKWLRVAGFIVGGFIVVTAVLSSPLFAIRNVIFEGTVYTSQETVTKVRDLLKGASIFTVDTALARKTLLDDPWVADVRITTDFPGGALVEVSERDPVVWYVGDDQKARVVDDRGHVIAVLDGWPTKYLQVKGTGPSVDAGATTDDVYRAAAQLVLALPGEIKGKVTSLELSAGGELSMELKGGTVVRFGPPEGLQDKLVAVVVLLRRQDPATLAVVDVSTGEATVQTR